MNGGDFLKRLALIFAMLLALITVFCPQVAEAKSYDIIQYKVIIDVMPNGDAKFEEVITYDFDGDFNGVLRNIDLDGSDGIEALEVFVVEGEGLRKFSPGTGEGINLYEISQEGNILALKVYEKTSSKEKTFLYTYTLKNVAEKYSDIGVFNRKVIDRNWDVPLHNINIEIRIPDGATRDELKVFAHGPLEGYSEIVDDRTFSFVVGEVRPGTFVETLAVFPPDLIPDAGRVYNREELPAILENEQRLAAEANRIREEARARMAREEKLRATRQRMFPIFAVALLSGVASLIHMNVKYGRELRPEFDGDYYRDLPGDYTPAVMTYLLTKGNVKADDIMATIMDLVRKKKLKINKIEGQEKRGLFSKRAVEKYMIKAVDGADGDGLLRHETFLKKWFVDELGMGQGLILDDLKEKVKKRSDALEFQRNYEAFKELVKMEGSKKGFFTANDLTGIGVNFAIALGLMAGGVLSIVFIKAWGFGIISVVLAAISLLNLLALGVKSKLTRFGTEQTAMWKAFKKFLLHFSNMDKAEIPSIAIWEHYLVYAISLGVAEEVLSQLPKVFSDAELKDPSLTYMGGHHTFHSFHHMNSMLTNTMSTVSSAINTAAVASSRMSSGSGAGGGFSGGSSGGSGGGGGGGAF